MASQDIIDTRAPLVCPICLLETYRRAQFREHMRAQHHLPDDLLPQWLLDIPYADQEYSINDRIYPCGDGADERWTLPPLHRVV